MRPKVLLCTKNIVLTGLLVISSIYSTSYAQTGYIDPVIIQMPNSATLSASIGTHKTSYQVGESIQFKIKTDKNAYIYILAKDNLGRTIQIFPNARQPNNLIAANAEHLLPAQNQTTSFVSDKAGIEKFTVIASVRALNFQDIFNVTQGNYQIGDTQRILDVLADQGIIINDKHSVQTADGMVISNIQVPITTATQVQAPVQNHHTQPSATISTATGLVMLSTNKSIYQKGEMIFISYIGRSHAPSAQIVLAIQDIHGAVRIVKQSASMETLQTATLLADPSIQKILLWEQVGSFGSVPASAATINLAVQ